VRERGAAARFQVGRRGEGGRSSYVAVNANVAWSKPLNIGQNSFAPVQVLKVNGFDNWGTSIRRFCSWGSKLDFMKS